MTPELSHSGLWAPLALETVTGSNPDCRCENGRLQQSTKARPQHLIPLLLTLDQLYGGVIRMTARENGREKEISGNFPEISNLADE